VLGDPARPPIVIVAEDVNVTDGRTVKVIVFWEPGVVDGSLTCRLVHFAPKIGPLICSAARVMALGCVLIFRSRAGPTESVKGLWAEVIPGDLNTRVWEPAGPASPRSVNFAIPRTEVACRFPYSPVIPTAEAVTTTPETFWTALVALSTTKVGCSANRTPAVP